MKGFIHRLIHGRDPRGGHEGSSRIEKHIGTTDHLYSQKDGDFFVGRTYAKDRWIYGGMARKLAHKNKQHLMLIGGTRAGKGRTVLMHNILDHPGNSFVFDPKGESAIICAEQLEKKGYRVVIIDPFRHCRSITQDNSLDRFMAGYNLFGDINPYHPSADMLIQSLSTILIKDEGTGGDSGTYWRDLGRAAVQALIAYSTVNYTPDQMAVVNSTPPDKLTLEQQNYVTQHINLTNTALFNQSNYERQSCILDYMVNYAGDEDDNGYLTNFVGGLMRNGAATMLQRFDKENDPLGYGSLMTTLGNNFLWAKPTLMQHSLEAPDRKFRMAQLKTDEKLAVFAVMPREFITASAPWIKMLVSMALNMIGLTPGRPKHPINIIVDEAPQLGFMPDIKNAFSIMAGSGARLVLVCQDLAQLQDIYGAGFETMIGNSSQLVLSVSDNFTTQYFSSKAGMTYAMDQKTKKKDMTKKVPALASDEIARFTHPDRGGAFLLEGGLGAIRVKLVPYDKEKRRGIDYRVHPEHEKPSDRLKRSGVKAIAGSNVLRLENKNSPATQRKGKRIEIGRKQPKRFTG